jgi:hypothetical protein
MLLSASMLLAARWRAKTARPVQSTAASPG